MEYQRPIVLSIAGLDPSGGAGLLADIKTLEQHQCLGFGVASALTVQTEDIFHSIDWLTFMQIQQQAAPLFDRYHIDTVKIGVIKDLETLHQLLSWIKEIHPNARVIWDTVLAPSASEFKFLENIDKLLLPEVLQQLFLVTPNIAEAVLLSSEQNETKAAEILAKHCNVLLKGGHSSKNKGIDYLFCNDSIIQVPSHLGSLPSKHGSGCIMSSAVAANMARGHTLLQACHLAKTYTERALNSNSNLLAYHNA